MKKIKLEKFSEQTLKIYKDFKEQTGSQNIAKPTTIEVLLEVCHEENPKRILEMGGGIGTISYLLLKNSGAVVDIYEDNDFCLRKLDEKLSEFNGRYNIITDYKTLPPVKDYDLVVVDGGSGRKNDGGYKMAVSNILSHLNSVKTVYIEGQRHVQRTLILKSLAKKYLYTLIRYDRVFFEGKQLTGGVRIKCKPNKSKFLRFINLIFWSFVEWYPVKNFVYYKFKKLFGK